MKKSFFGFDARVKNTDLSVEYSFTSAVFSIGISMEEIERVLAEI